MPISIPPADIEYIDFSGGWMPDLQESAVPPNALLDVINLLPDRETGTIETRKGYQRFGELLTSHPALADFEVRTLVPFNRNSGATDELGTQFLMAVLRKKPRPNPREADDVRIYYIDVQTGTAARVDHAGRIWTHFAAAHWGETIDNRYYGGSERDPMYAFQPTFKNGAVNPEPYEPDASMGQYCTTQWATGTAYAVGDRRWDTVALEKLEGGLYERKFVFICTSAHTSQPWNRPGSEITVNEDGEETSTMQRSGGERRWEMVGRYIPEWASGTTYKVGQKVSYFVNDAALAAKYPRYYATVNKRSTFICTREHTSSVSNPPPTGAWEPFRAPVTNVAKAHGGRLFVRDSDAGSGLLHYSALISGDGLFDASDWDSDDIQGSGFFPVASGDGDDVRALESLNQYLIITKRRSTWTLSGYNPSTWQLRQISDKGCLYKRAMVPHEGLVYFIGDQGFFQTDGVIVQEVPNSNVIRDWLHDNVDLEGNNIYKISMTSFMGFIWISFPAGESVVRPNITLVYDPVTTSWWKLDMETWEFAVNRKDRVDELFFAKVGTPALVMRYARTTPGGLPDTNIDKDDTGVAIQAFREIPWFARFGWLTFGSSKEQRRIRRLWVQLKANAMDVTLKLWRDFNNAVPAWSVTRTTSAKDVNYVEGRVVRENDPHAISLEVSGTKAPAAILSANVNTQFRRKRYNRGPRA